MTDTSPLSSLETTTIQEGVKFLFAQATDLLGRWRAARQGGVERVRSSGARDAVLDGELAPARVDEPPAAQREALAELRRRAGDYVDGVLAIAPDDAQLLETVEALRAALEQALGQRITFKGETGRPATGTPTRVTDAIGALTVTGERAIGVQRNSGTLNTGDRPRFR